MNVKRFLCVVLFLLLWLAGCTPKSATPTQSSPITPTASAVAVTFTPETLSPANVKSIIPLRRYGMGVPTDLAYAPDGSLIAVSTSIGIYRYDPQSFAELPLIETNAYVRSLAFSPDSHLIAAGEENGGLRLWEARDGTLVRELQGHAGRVKYLAFSPDGQLLASAAYAAEGEVDSSIVKIWRVEDGTLLVKSVEFARRLDPVEVSALVFSPKGDLLISATGMVFVLDKADWHVIQTLEAYNGNPDLLKEHYASLTGLAFSPDGEMLAAADQDHTVQFWRTSDWEWIDQTITVPEQRPVDELVYSPDGKLLIGSGEPVRFWDAKTRLLLSSPSISGDIAPAPDGTSLAVLRKDVLELWRLADFSLIHQWTGFMAGVYSLDVSPDGQVLAAGTWQGPARLLQVKDGSLLQTLESAQENLHFSSDGQTLLAVQYDVQFWSLDGNLRDTYKWLSGTAESAAYSPDGRLLAVGLEKDGVEVMKSSKRDVLFTLKWKTKFYNPISAVAFSPDSRLLATGDREPAVRLWNMKDGRLISALEGHTSDVEDLAFSPDGTVLASASLDRTVRLWRVEDGSLLKVLEHPGYVYDVAFSPDGLLLASACSDGTIKLWDRNGNLLKTLSAHTTVVSSVVFLPDGLTLASGSPDGTVWVWGLDRADQ